MKRARSCGSVFEAIMTLAAAEDELATIATAIGATGAGWLQVIADFDEQLPEEFAMLRRLAAAAGRPMTMTVLERDSKPEEWRRLLDGIAAANADGIAMTGQVLTRPTGILLGFEISQHPFVDCPSYQPIAALPFAERLAALRDPGLRGRLIAEATAPTSLGRRVRSWDRIFALGDPPDYEPAAENSMGAEARRRGVDPASLTYDRLLE